jgi:hypothetical protein
MVAGDRVRGVHCTEDTLVVDLEDERTIIVPIVWFPRLLHATAEQRANWRISGERRRRFGGTASRRGRGQRSRPRSAARRD